jgi:D-alanyl-D-alanine carboxypeptidase-like protein
MLDRRVLRGAAAGAVLVALLAASCTSPQPAETTGREVANSAPSVAPPTASPDAVSAPEPVPPRFDGRVFWLNAARRRRMRGTTWKPGCPVPLDDLRLLRFNYWNFYGEVDRGPMVVHEDVAGDVLWVFRRLFRARFPIKRVALAREFVPEEFEPVTYTRRSVTAAFNCRPVILPTGPLSDFSRHSYGLAIDINPIQNPYVAADGFVRTMASRRYLDRTRRLKGMIHDGDVVVRSFAAIGWGWGGHWGGGKDYMHFDSRR